MTARTWLAATVVIVASLAVAICCLTFVPKLIYPQLVEQDLGRVTSAEGRLQLQQAQGQLQNGVRSTLLQCLAGTLVIIGAFATWRQVGVNREGQITERFTRAIEQIGSEKVDVRIGAVYALERIARNSPEDRNNIQFILAAFVRNNSPWHVGADDGPEHPTSVIENRPWLQIVAPDIQAAVGVLSRRLPSRDVRGPFKGGARLYLSRVDLRGLQLTHGDLIDTQLRYVNLARSWLQGARFDRSDLREADLRRSRLERASLFGVSLLRAYLAESNLSGADLRESDLRGASLQDAVLDDAILSGARADSQTIWPAGFDAERLCQLGVKTTS
ncbi:pentapeptide repeat-containing protein [Amycolatopsis lexingtonensis]|uniref:pentapeptide repeat-containing protein n=1 Tax=Amycolatopsis lexingtonensis TaxID=218822 RepID=UPI003F70C68C